MACEYADDARPPGLCIDCHVYYHMMAMAPSKKGNQSNHSTRRRGRPVMIEHEGKVYHFTSLFVKEIVDIIEVTGKAAHESLHKRGIYRAKNGAIVTYEE